MRVSLVPSWHPATSSGLRHCPDLLCAGGKLKIGHVCHARDAGGQYVQVRPPQVLCFAESTRVQNAAELASLFSGGAAEVQMAISPTTLSTATFASSGGSQDSDAQSSADEVPPGKTEVGTASSAQYEATSASNDQPFVNLSAVMPPALGRCPSQEEMAAHRVLLLKKNPAVRAQFSM